MYIKRPIKSNFLTQEFGGNRTCVLLEESGKPKRPFIVVNSTRGICPMGSSPFYQEIGLIGHNGWDHATWMGEPVYFPVVAKTEWRADTETDKDGGIGLDVYSNSRVEIDVLPPQTGPEAKAEWDANDHRLFVKFRFWHAKENKKADAMDVVTGDLIQFSDSTGAASASHLHWALKFCDKDENTLDRNNGYAGAVDFRRWYEDVFILDYLKLKAQVENIEAEVKEVQLSLADVLTKFVFNLQQMLNRLKGR